MKSREGNGHPQAEITSLLRPSSHADLVSTLDSFGSSNFFGGWRIVWKEALLGASSSKEKFYGAVRSKVKTIV